MNSTITLENKRISVSLSNAAEQALQQRTTPLLAEMELYFSCLIRKVVRFYETPGSDSVSVNDKLALRFHPVMTKHCGLDYEGNEPPLTDFPIANAGRYVPNWLNIDYRNGEWHGEFGYLDAERPR